MAPGECQQGIEITAHIEARSLTGGQIQHKVRTHEIQHWRLPQAGRNKHASIQRRRRARLMAYARIRRRARHRPGGLQQAFAHSMTSSLDNRGFPPLEAALKAHHTPACTILEA